MKPEEQKPTDKELEILQVLWEKGPCAVKDVHEAMGGDQSNGYTTILKFMQIMHEKGLLTRQKSGKLHLYQAASSREKTQQQILNRMIDTVFKGSASQLILSALGNSKASAAELSQIKDYLNKMDNGHE